MVGRRESLEHGVRRINQCAREKMECDDMFWYVLMVISGKEILVQQVLNRQNITVYLPLCRKWKRVNRYKREKSKIAYPAISGCVFIGFQQGQERWLDIFETAVSAYGVLGNRGSYPELNGDRMIKFINKNKILFDIEKEENNLNTKHSFNIGDKIHIVEGVLNGYIVNINDIRGKKANILINLLGKKRSAEILLDDLQKKA